MIQFKLWINTDNAAFDRGRRSHEVARILREISVRLDHGQPFNMYETLRDLSGNDVGRAAFKEEEAN